MSQLKPKRANKVQQAGIQLIKFSSPSVSKHVTTACLPCFLYMLLCCNALLLLNSSQVRANEQAGSEYKETTRIFGDWQVRCEQNQESGDSCVMMQDLYSKANGQRVLQANFAKISEGTLMTLILPLGIYLPGGVTIQIEDFEEYRFEIMFCSQEGCFVNSLVPPQLLEWMRRKERARLTVLFKPDQPVDLPYSISGFLDAHRSLPAAR